MVLFGKLYFQSLGHDAHGIERFDGPWPIADYVLCLPASEIVTQFTT